MKTRLKYLSYPRIQLVIVGAFLVAMVLFFSIVLLFLTGAISHLVDMGKEANLPSDHIYFQFITMQTKSILTSLLYALAVMSALGTIFFIWFSHSLVGPIVALIEYLKRSKDQLRQGQNINPIQFRKSDHFQDLAQLLNETLNLAIDCKPNLMSEKKKR